jgi:hypothetical protein
MTDKDLPVFCCVNRPARRHSTIMRRREAIMRCPCAITRGTNVDRTILSIGNLCFARVEMFLQPERFIPTRADYHAVD